MHSLTKSVILVLTALILVSCGGKQGVVKTEGGNIRTQSDNTTQVQKAVDVEFDAALDIANYFIMKAYDGDKRLYTSNDLVVPEKLILPIEALSGQGVTYNGLLENEIYARHNAMLKPAIYQKIFNLTTWYDQKLVKSGFNNYKMNDVENGNIKYLENEIDINVAKDNHSLIDYNNKVYRTEFTPITSEISTTEIKFPYFMFCLNNEASVWNFDSLFNQWNVALELNNNKLNYQIVMKVKKGDLIKVLDVKGVWVKIDYSRTNGWVLQKYLGNDLPSINTMSSRSIDKYKNDPMFNKLSDVQKIDYLAMNGNYKPKYLFENDHFIIFNNNQKLKEFDLNKSVVKFGGRGFEDEIFNAICAHDKNSDIYYSISLNNGKIISEFHNVNNYSNQDVVLSPDGKYILVTSDDNGTYYVNSSVKVFLGNYTAGGFYPEFYDNGKYWGGKSAGNKYIFGNDTGTVLSNIGNVLYADIYKDKLLLTVGEISNVKVELYRIEDNKLVFIKSLYIGDADRAFISKKSENIFYVRERGCLIKIKTNKRDNEVTKLPIFIQNIYEANANTAYAIRKNRNKTIDIYKIEGDMQLNVGLTNISNENYKVSYPGEKLILMNSNKYLIFGE